MKNDGDDLESYVTSINRDDDAGKASIVSGIPVVFTGLAGLAIRGFEGAFYGTIAAYCIAEIFKKIGETYERRKATKEEPLLFVIDDSGKSPLRIPLYEVQEGMLKILPDDCPSRKQIEQSIARVCKDGKIKKKVPII